jgi:hypothetical protein
MARMNPPSVALHASGPSTSLALPDAQPILPRLSGAASLRAELEALLQAAPPDASPATYRELLLNANVAGKGSASARLWLWKRIKLRYVLDPACPEFRAFLVGMNATLSPQQRGLLCLLMLARTDRLFREVTLECVSPLLAREGTVVEPAPVLAAIRSRADAAGLSWSANTLDRTHKHLLTALKNFGILAGAAKKRTVHPRPAPEVTLFGARLARLEGRTDRQTLDALWFRVLGLSVDQVIDLLYAAGRAGALSFRLQADVVELKLPPEAA